MLPIRLSEAQLSLWKWNLVIHRLVELTQIILIPQTDLIAQWQNNWEIQLSQQNLRQQTIPRKETRDKLCAAWTSWPSFKKHSRSIIMARSSSTLRHQLQCRTRSWSRTTTPQTSMHITNRWPTERRQWVVRGVTANLHLWEDRKRNWFCVMWKEEDQRQEMVIQESYMKTTWLSLAETGTICPLMILTC